MSIDYGFGKTNIDVSNGIRYGVIPMHLVTQAWCDSSEMDFGTPCCPKCGCDANKLDEFGETFADGFDDEVYDSAKYDCEIEFFCPHCEYGFGTESAYSDECLGTYIQDDEYRAYCDQCNDIMVMKSPYYTLCEFCSPCAPGAGYCQNSGNIRAYCLGIDFFENAADCPHPIYRVSDDTLVYSPTPIDAAKVW